MKERTKLHFKDMDNFEKEFIGENEHDKNLSEKEQQLYIYEEFLYNLNSNRY